MTITCNITSFVAWKTETSAIDVKLIFACAEIGVVDELDIVSIGLHAGGHLGQCFVSKNPLTPTFDDHEKLYSTVANCVEFKIIFDDRVISVNIYANGKVKISAGATGAVSMQQHDETQLDDKQRALDAYVSRIKSLVREYILTKSDEDIGGGFRVVNITSAFQYKVIKKMGEFVRDARPFVNMQYEPEIFAGIKAKVLSDDEHMSSAIIHHTGHVTICGCTTVHQVLSVFNQIILAMDVCLGEGPIGVPKNITPGLERRRLMKKFNVGFAKKAAGEKRQKRCGLCNELGHNKKTCKRV